MATPKHVSSSISVEDVARLPRPGTSAPTSFAFSPDSSLVTYLYGGGNLSQQLYALDLKEKVRRLVFDYAFFASINAMSPYNCRKRSS